VSSDLTSSLAADGESDNEGSKSASGAQSGDRISGDDDPPGSVSADETLPEDGLSAFQWLVVGSGTTIAIAGLVAALAGVLEVSTPVLLLVSAGAVLLAAWRGYTYLVTGISVTELPTVGVRAGVHRVGSDLDGSIRSADGTGKQLWDEDSQERGSAQVAVRRRLEPLAARLLADREGCSEQAATERLRDGTWTENPVAARLFEQGTDENRLRALVRGTPSVS
jgi:hypothetical protein